MLRSLEHVRLLRCSNLFGKGSTGGSCMEGGGPCSSLLLANPTTWAAGPLGREERRSVVTRSHDSQSNEPKASPSGRHVDPAEVAKFGAMAAEWWDPEGSSAFLHRMNPLRATFIRDAICTTFGRMQRGPEALKGLSVLDVGCGGGLLSEALARMGAKVTGIDAAPEAVRVAEAHAAYDPVIADRTSYQVATAEALLDRGERYSAVVASEVIEHVPDPPGFCAALAALTDAPGTLVLSTLNRTPRAYALAILGAEYLLRAVPIGTHDWKRFITPEELVMMTSEHGLDLRRLSGMVYNPITTRWQLSSDTAVNYIAVFQKHPSGHTHHV